MIPLQKQQPPPAGASLRLEVVVADDIAEIREFVAIILQADGHAVTMASSGRELIRIVKERSFDLVVTDIVMPDGDGWDAILTINRLRPETKILAISGGGEKMPKDACLRVAKGVGADRVLKKPFLAAQLRAAVAAVMNR